MKKVKYLWLLSSLVLTFSLASCDFSSIFKDSSRTNTSTEETKTDNSTTEDKTEEKTNTEEGTGSKTSTDGESGSGKSTEGESGSGTSTEGESGSGTSTDGGTGSETKTETEDSYDLSIYLNDYKNKYGYLALGTDLEHGELMQNAYAQFYEASKAVLLSTENYEIDTSKSSDGTTLNFLNVYSTEGFESMDDFKYYQSAWSVFVAENPIFYFLSNGTLSRSSVETITEKQGDEIISQKEVTTYSFILVGFDTFASFDARDVMNKKLDNLFKNTAELADVENDYLKVIAISSYLNSNLTYAYKEDKTPDDSYWAHNILGLLDNKKGVCECYAKSFELLTDYYNVNAISVYGLTDTNEAHAWNYVNIGDNWYGMDATWNDTILEKDNTKSITDAKYFLCSSSTMALEHNPYGSTYGLNYQPSIPTLSDVAYTIS